MLKRLIFAVVLMFIGAANAAEMVNVEYIHQAIKQRWDIEVPYNKNLKNPKVAANMKYLLTAVDVANKILNGEATTSYGNDENYATRDAADTVATNEAVRRLVELKPKFFVTTTTATTSFSFTISAAGIFLIDWGDGNQDTVRRTDTTVETYSHDYQEPGEYTIGIGGNASAYSTNVYTAAISFVNNTNVAKIQGSLGKIFGTIGDGESDGAQPRFYETFYNNTNLKGNIPGELFAGISGPPINRMFFRLFRDCRGLTGAIPSGLFADISGAPAENMFNETFCYCTGLTAIPDGLFVGIKGEPAPLMFNSTFNSCKGIGSIPENLFAGISGPPANGMFNATFDLCTNLTAIPENLFGDISGPAATNMFGIMFYGCNKLASASAKINGKYLYEIWPDATTTQVHECYRGAGNLKDYASIPSAWK